MARSKSKPGLGPAGILLVDKPAGITSAAVVAIVKRALGGPKVGHLGTLDPFATGLLPLCIGEATKAAPYWNLSDKGYQGLLRLGVSTDTLDATGKELARQPCPALDRIDLEELAAAFTGEIEQVPPAYSAIKQGGRRSYELARAGQAAEPPPRRVHIHSLRLTVHGDETLQIVVECSKGTYIRSLARDIGDRLGCGALLQSLRRTRFGPFDLSDALALARIQEQDGGIAAAQATIGLLDALAHLPLHEIDRAAAAELRQGRQALLATLVPPRGSQESLRLACGGQLVAVAGAQGGSWRLDRVFAPQAELEQHH